jgi:hypothetical protein
MPSRALRWSWFIRTSGGRCAPRWCHPGVFGCGKWWCAEGRRPLRNIRFCASSSTAGILHHCCSARCEESPLQHAHAGCRDVHLHIRLRCPWYVEDSGDIHGCWARFEEQAQRDGPAGHRGTAVTYFRVVWGTSQLTGFTSELVSAFDAEEALVVAASRHPERWRPSMALRVTNSPFTDQSPNDVHCAHDHSPV